MRDGESPEGNNDGGSNFHAPLPIYSVSFRSFHATTAPVNARWPRASPVGDAKSCLVPPNLP
jgi:hypothetical protein